MPLRDHGRVNNNPVNSSSAITTYWEIRLHVSPGTTSLIQKSKLLTILDETGLFCIHYLNHRIDPSSAHISLTHSSQFTNRSTNKIFNLTITKRAIDCVEFHSTIHHFQLNIYLNHAEKRRRRRKKLVEKLKWNKNSIIIWK